MSVKLFYIGIFGLIGVYLRYFAVLSVSKMYPGAFPWGTFLINTGGAFLIGIIYVLGFEKANISENLRVGLMAGLLGGFTTFSSYSLEAVILVEQTKYFLSAIYLIASSILGVVAAFAGMALARNL